MNMKSRSDQESEWPEMESLKDLADEFTFFEGDVSQWASDASNLLRTIFGDSHHGTKDLSLVVQSIDYAPHELASDLYRHDEWEQVKERILKILRICQQELNIIAAQRYRSQINLDEIYEYVSLARIQELKSLQSNRVDLTKLVRLCEELNIAYTNQLNLSVAMLLRAILDHIPPIFSKTLFKYVASQYGGQSFKDTMRHLENGARKIADSHLHAHIRRREVLPTPQQVNFSQYLDVLLAEVIAILRAEAV